MDDREHFTNQTRDQITANWNRIVARLDPATPGHVIDHLQYEFIRIGCEDFDGTYTGKQWHQDGRLMVVLKARPHVIEAFTRQAHEMRFSRDPATVGNRPVKSSRVPRGIVAGRARAKRESVR